MIKVYSHFNSVKLKTPSGTMFLNKYQEQIEDGHKSLVKVGEENIHDLTQMDLENTKIDNILQKMAIGDYSSLRETDGSYVDATTMPKSLQEAQNLVLRMKAEFEKMPIEVKNKFNNSPDKYVELMGTKEFNDIMAPFNEKVAKIAEEKSHKEYLKKVADGAKLNYDIRVEEERLKLAKGGENK